MNARRRLNKADDPRVTRTRNDVLAEAINILVNDGWDAVTYARVAAQSGYSRAIISAHWPERIDLMRDAFTRYEQTPHPEKSGDPEADLRAEVISFSRAMVEFRLKRVLATLAERSQTTPEVIGIRDSFVATGERPMRETLLNVASGPPQEAALLMLCGMVTHSVLLHGKPPKTQVVDSAIEMVLSGLGQR